MSPSVCLIRMHTLQLLLLQKKSEIRCIYVGRNGHDETVAMKL